MTRPAWWEAHAVFHTRFTQVCDEGRRHALWYYRWIYDGRSRNEENRPLAKRGAPVSRAIGALALTTLALLTAGCARDPHATQIADPPACANLDAQKWGRGWCFEGEWHCCNYPIPEDD